MEKQRYKEIEKYFAIEVYVQIVGALKVYGQIISREIEK